MTSKKKIKPRLTFTVRLILLTFFSLLMSSLIVILTILIAKWSRLNIPPSNFTSTVILAFAMSCIVGTVCSAFLSKHLTDEHAKFKETITQVANGNFDVKFPDEPDKLYGPIGKELNKMVKELKSVNVLRNDFVSNFSHELKTPITSIKGYAELLMGEVSESEKKEFAQTIFDESTRLLKLATNTLLLSKLESQGVCNSNVFQLDELVEECLLLLAKDFEKKNISLTTDLKKVVFYWDDSLLGQAIINLVSNAVKYTAHGGNIRVELREAEEVVYFIVKDNGCGMNKQTMSRIFEKYYQGDNSHKTEGNGLGLSIVAKIANLCNGKITVESVVGRGSVFTLTLPKKKSPVLIPNNIN